MNCDNAQYMVTIFQIGFAAGMTHRYECYMHYDRLLYQYTEHYLVKEEIDRFWNVVLEFEKGLAGSSEEESELRFYTVEQLIKDIEDWYARDNKA